MSTPQPPGEPGPVIIPEPSPAPSPAPGPVIVPEPSPVPSPVGPPEPGEPDDDDSELKAPSSQR